LVWSRAMSNDKASDWNSKLFFITSMLSPFHINNLDPNVYFQIYGCLWEYAGNNEIFAIVVKYDVAE
jgi:hypothetical protein